MKKRLMATALVAGFAGLVLLSLRQERIAAVHEMNRLHFEGEQVRAHMWRVRAEITAAARPELIRPDEVLQWKAATAESSAQP